MVVLEKNGGFKNVKCGNQLCKYEFCWVCLGSWKPHSISSFSCNPINNDIAQEARVALERYLHYRKCYETHSQSLELENGFSDQLKVIKLLEDIMENDVRFLQTVCDVLRQCRQTLIFSYPFVFYLRKNNQS